MNVPALEDLLLIGGVVLVALGVIAGVIVLVVAARRRREEAQHEADPAAAPWAELSSTSPFAAFNLEPAAEPEAEPSGSADSPAAAEASAGEPFVAPPKPEPVIEVVESASSEAAASDSAASVPLAPTVPADADRPAWGDILAQHPEADPDEFGFTTGSFAVPPLAATPSASAAEAPYVNPWTDEDSAEAPVRSTPEPEAAPEPEAEPAPAAAAEPTPAPEPAPAAEAAPAPEPAPAHSSDAAPETPADAPDAPDEATVLVPGRGTEPVARWLLILDTGERVEIAETSVVLGRKPQPVEHGLPGVRVPDATRTISKVHARIDRIGDHWSLTDLGSTNGSSIIESGGRERVLPSGGSEVIRGRFLLGEVGMVLVRNPAAG